MQTLSQFHESTETKSRSDISYLPHPAFFIVWLHMTFSIEQIHFLSLLQSYSTLAAHVSTASCTGNFVSTCHDSICLSIAFDFLPYLFFSFLNPFKMYTIFIVVFIVMPNYVEEKNTNTCSI